MHHFWSLSRWPVVHCVQVLRISGRKAHRYDHWQGCSHAASGSWYATTAIRMAVSSAPLNSRSTRIPQVPASVVELLVRLIPSRCRLDLTNGGYPRCVKSTVLSFFSIHWVEIGSLHAAMCTVWETATLSGARDPFWIDGCYTTSGVSIGWLQDDNISARYIFQFRKKGFHPILLHLHPRCHLTFCIVHILRRIRRGPM
mmetsp:Transcript_3588/g.22513  ORF Transcript_3588/g.22513 Transcript_3588/m.22513 type:complete len:199 (+) Transcript_3588:2455-3051(+)